MTEETKDVQLESAAEKREMIPIWFWVGMVLGVYGIIITICGLYYLISPETRTATHAWNPSLWWGLIMLGAGAAFFFPSRPWKKKAQKETK